MQYAYNTQNYILNTYIVYTIFSVRTIINFSVEMCVNNFSFKISRQSL